MIEVLTLAAAVFLALLAGRLVSKLKLPGILGWLIMGMILGPHAVGLLGDSLLDSQWFHLLETALESIVGLMIGSELIWKKMRQAGKQIFVTTLTESLGTFLTVSIVFGVIFWLTDIPLYLAVMFGAVSLATAPAPSLSIVNEMKTDGPVTKTLIPMAALDDLAAALVFFVVIALVSAHISTQKIPVPLVLFLVFLPVLIGIVTGWLTGMMLKRISDHKTALIVMGAMLAVSDGIGMLVNGMLGTSILNFMLLGMAFSTTVFNLISEETVCYIMKKANPVIGIGLVIVILNLGAPLDYHLILGAGFYAFLYIFARAVGKYAGAYTGAAMTHAPETVKKYLGLTLLPHSGVSLIFTGISVSVLGGAAPECAQIIQGTIAAAAVINEVIAVFMAKKGFEWAGELHKRR